MPSSLLDPEKVQLAKMYREMGKTAKWIASELGTCQRTIYRYWNTADPVEADTTALVAARTKEVERLIGESWENMHLLTAQLKLDIKAGKITGKDAAIVWGIIGDKILTFQAKSMQRGESKPAITFNFVRYGDNNTTLSNPTPVPCIEGAIQSDGVWRGSGEDVFGVLGSGTDCPGEEMPGRDSGEHVSEYEGLCSPDDNGGALGSPGN